MTETTFLLRFGEFTLKSPPVRRRMQQRMLNNLRDGMKLHGVKAKIQSTWARVFVTTPAPDVVRGLLQRLFGLHSFSEIERFPFAGEAALVERATEYFGPLVPGTRFAVRARREKKLPVSTSAIQVQLGARLCALGGIVDLSNPDLTCAVELRGKEVYLSAKKEAGPCGMPLGTEDRVLSLISGGFDSPVATWHMMRRGVPCDFLYFELGGMAHRGAIYAHLQHLHRAWGFGTNPQLYVIPGKPILKALELRVQQKYWNVMLKRIFYRVGEQLVKMRKYNAIVTGEVIAQVSSQTLSNLRAIEHGINVLFLRPLLTTEKDDIIAMSRTIGTHDTSAQVREYCAITPQQPATRSNAQLVAGMEESLGGIPWYESLLAQHEQIAVASVDPAQVRYLEAIIDRLPKQALWIDMREEEGPPLPQPAMRITLEALIEDPTQLSQEETYLLLCDVGMLSAEAAFMLQELDYKAFAFQGGIMRLNRLNKTTSSTTNATAATPPAQTTQPTQ